MTHLHRLLEAWITGWAHSRGTPMPQPRTYGFELHVGLPGHIARHALPGVDAEAIGALADAIDMPGILHRLSERALRAGATRGVLVATEAGRALYTGIGWRVESPLTTAERIDFKRPGASTC